METVKLFYKDVYMKEFTAVVLSCEPVKKAFDVVLDQTAFYPEGGGQPYDMGMLGEAKVLEVHEKEGVIRHRVDRALEIGETVKGVLDWDRRFDLMQQHSGEHMVSGIIHERWGYENVGFHMGSDVVTIDLSGMISPSELKEVESEVNRRIWENKAVEITYPSSEELKTIPYRSKKELTGQVRIVTYPGTDICACCGTHVANTGEIGMVRLLSVEHFRQGVRIEMLCGGRVLNYLRSVDEQNRAVSVTLSAKPSATGAAAQRLLAENNAMKGRIARMEEASFAQTAASCAGKGNVLLFESGLESDSVRRLCDAVLNTCGGRAAVFSDNGDGTMKYAIGEKDGDLRALTRELNGELNGRGGGKPFFVQGSVKADMEAVRAFFEKN